MPEEKAPINRLGEIASRLRQLLDEAGALARELAGMAHIADVLGAVLRGERVAAPARHPGPCSDVKVEWGPHGANDPERYA